MTDLGWRWLAEDSRSVGPVCPRRPTHALSWWSSSSSPCRRSPWPGWAGRWWGRRTLWGCRLCPGDSWRWCLEIVANIESQQWMNDNRSPLSPCLDHIYSLGQDKQAAWPDCHIWTLLVHIRLILLLSISKKLLTSNLDTDRLRAYSLPSPT